MPHVEILPPDHVIRPMPDPVVTNAAGDMWINHPTDPGRRVYMRAYPALGVSWAPFREIDGVLLHMWAGLPAEGILPAITRKELRKLIAGLQSIDQQLEEML